MWIDQLLVRLRATSWFWELPPWLREPPGLWIALALVAALAAAALQWAVVHLWRALRGDAVEAQVRREIRTLRRAGDWLAVGRHYESVDRPRPALDAYKKGGHHAERTDLLIRLGRGAEAKTVAREGELWRLYAELCEADGEQGEAAASYERAGQDYAAARCYEADGQPQAAAACYQRAGLDARAIELLAHGSGRSTAETLEAAIRSSLGPAAGPRGDDEALTEAVRRGVQMWLEQGEVDRAYHLAIDSEQWEVAVPIARDYLEPSREGAEVCLRAGNPLAASAIWERLGESREAALARAEHALRQENPAEAAQSYEAAEEWALAADQWAAAGHGRRAAELFVRAGEHEQAARLFAQLGEPTLERRAREQQHRTEAGRRALTEEVAAFEDDRPTVVDAAGFSLPVPPSPGLPEAGPRYVLGAELGRGGMGVVYRAEDRMLERSVAFKRVAAKLDAGVAEALLAEARAAARLSHPNIVQVYDAGRDGEGFFLVMELVDGEPLSDVLERRHLSVDEVAEVALQVASALDHAHRRRVIHRDIKPSNLLWASADSQRPEASLLVKLTDFGLARFIEDSLGKILTRPAGTPSYMAPEQIRGEAVDPRADLYSLGCVMFEMLCARGPFGGGSSIYQHLNAPPRDPRLYRDETPEPFAALVMRCLAKEADRRPVTAAEVVATLQELRSR